MSTEQNISERYEALLQFLYMCPVGIIRLTLNGNIEQINPKATMLLMQISAKDDAANLFSTLSQFAPELRNVVSAFAEPHGTIVENYTIDVRHGAARKDAPSLVLALTLIKVDAATLMAVLTDISKLAEQEQMIRSKEARLRAIFDGVRDYAIYTLDPQGNIETWNQSAQRVEGYRPEEVLGQPFGMDYPLDAQDPARSGYQLRLAQQYGWYEDEGWRVRRDGSRFWANSIVSVLGRSDSQTVDGYSVITRDITERKRTEDELRRLASTDFLTGALNRRRFFEEAQRHVMRATRASVPFSLVLVDADHFKRINDTYGHSSGDVVLKELVNSCQGSLRTEDLVARYGGEEFVILLPGVTQQRALIVAERIRAAVEKSILVVEGREIRYTISLGVAQFADSVEETLRQADRALYLAKAGGRNCVVAS